VKDECAVVLIRAYLLGCASTAFSEGVFSKQICLRPSVTLYRLS
jgi:hypothetical protein